MCKGTSVGSIAPSRCAPAAEGERLPRAFAVILQESSERRVSLHKRKRRRGPCLAAPSSLLDSCYSCDSWLLFLLDGEVGEEVLVLLPLGVLGLLQALDLLLQLLD